VSAPQYEPCEHRHGSGLMGVEAPEYYDTPCQHCAEAERFTSWLVAIVLVVAVLAAVGIVWSLL
jgi:hypothetical protein